MYTETFQYTIWTFPDTCHEKYKLFSAINSWNHCRTLTTEESQRYVFWRVSLLFHSQNHVMISMSLSKKKKKKKIQFNCLQF